MANPSCLFECQEEQAMLELGPALHWELLPDPLKLIWCQDRKEYRDDRLVHRQ